MVSSGRSIPAQAIISNVVATERRGSFMSFNASVQQIFVGLASVISGKIVTRAADNTILHYPMTGYISIAITILSLYVGYLLHKRLKKSDTKNVATVEAATTEPVPALAEKQ